MKRIKLAVIGATGSVGGSALDICRRFPDRFEVAALAADKNAGALLSLAEEFRAPVACLSSPSAADGARFKAIGAELLAGPGGLSAIACGDADQVVFASSGTGAIVPLAEALDAGKDVSLANKESIAAAGPWIMPLVRRPDQLRPVDSEHSAIWQCLRGEPAERVRKIYLTASGGPFREMSLGEMAGVTPEDALRHPVWNMGAKITIDSATLMNKGIECIEAMQLFGLPPSKVGALIHPSSLVHGIVEYSDAVMKLLLSRPDMRLPCAAALAWPDKLELGGEEEFAIPPAGLWRMEFAEPDAERFPCLGVALRAASAGPAYPPLLIGADQFAVGAFLERRLPFLKIAEVAERALDRWRGEAPRSIEDAVNLIAEGERLASEVYNNIMIAS